jgi:hypothetical protein
MRTDFADFRCSRRNRNKERFMTKQTLKNFLLASGLFGLALTSSAGWAQVGLGPRLPGKQPATAAAQAANHQAKTPGPSYTYTLLSFPGSLSTTAISINPGATTSKIEIVGIAGQDGILASVSLKKTVTETYKAVNYPHAAGQGGTQGVNDLGQIVGIYIDGSGTYHGYKLSGGRFTTLDVPFAGATATFTYGINNSGEVVGGWIDSDRSGHGFTLTEGTYASFDFPGGNDTQAFSINSAGDIVGPYNDASGITHGFLLSGGTFTSIDFPGALASLAGGINDSGEIVGDYCATNECAATDDWNDGFLLSEGIFTTIAIPGEIYTIAQNINNNGVVVGFYQDAAGLAVSFLATP